MAMAVSFNPILTNSVGACPDLRYRAQHRGSTTPSHAMPQLLTT